MRSTFRLAIVVLFSATVCHAASVCVNPGGTGGCLASIQQAVNAIAPRGRVDVATGTYAESVSIAPGAAIRISGAGAGLTIIDGTDGGIVLEVNANFNSLGSRVAVSDVSLTDGAKGVLVHLNGGTQGHALISRCIISGNTAEGVEVGGSLKMTESTVTSNGGHGVYVYGRAKIDRSTITGNGGDGIHCLGGNCLIRTSTISGNVGTGLVANTNYFGFRVVVGATTIAGNGIGAFLRPVTYVQSTIIADSTSGPDVDSGSTFNSRGYNLFETVDPSAIIDGSTNDQTGVDPMLGPLQDNGGPTETHELLAGSPALESSLVSCGRADQRLVSRGASPCDTGAFEAP
jgi:hypothetical protein